MATNANVKKLVPQWATMTINNINESQLEAAIKAQKSNTDLGCWNEPTEAR